MSYRKCKQNICSTFYEANQNYVFVSCRFLTRATSTIGISWMRLSRRMMHHSFHVFPCHCASAEEKRPFSAQCNACHFAMGWRKGWLTRDPCCAFCESLRCIIRKYQEDDLSNVNNSAFLSIGAQVDAHGKANRQRYYVCIAQPSTIIMCSLLSGNNHPLSA